MTDGCRTALVTGANRGIGLAVAKGLAAQGGVRVLAAARTAKQAETAAREIGSGATGVTLELSDPAKAGKRALDIESEHSPIDILNNAAILVSGDALSVSPRDFLRSLQINAAFPFALIHELGPRMKQRGWGRIINISSGLGSFHEGLERPAAYSVSKAALNAITISAANAWSRRKGQCCVSWLGLHAHGRRKRAALTRGRCRHAGLAGEAKLR